MKNIKVITPIESVLFTNNEETLLLHKGLNVSIITDKNEFNNDYLGTIEWVTVDGIQLENANNRHILFDYIEEITINDK